MKALTRKDVYWTREIYEGNETVFDNWTGTLLDILLMESIPVDARIRFALVKGGEATRGLEWYGVRYSSSHERNSRGQTMGSFT